MFNKFDLPVEDICGYNVISATAEEVTSSVAEHVEAGRTCAWLACLNPHSYVVAREKPAFSMALKSADWLIADGTGIILASVILGGDLRLRLTGPDLFIEINNAVNARGAKVFFLGSTEENLAEIRKRQAIDWPNLNVVGTYSPPFKPEFAPEDDDEIIRAINAAKPDILWVGLTAPKQELWLAKNVHRLDVPFAAAIGATFDFYTDRVKRAHPVFQRSGLDWLARLLQEPKRLWRRTFISAPIFLGVVFKLALSNRVSQKESR